MDGENCKFIFIPKTVYAAENCKYITRSDAAPKSVVNLFKPRCLFIVFPAKQNPISLTDESVLLLSYIIFVFVH